METCELEIEIYFNFNLFRENYKIFTVITFFAQ